MIRNILLIGHILGVVVAVGSVTLAISRFPAAIVAADTAVAAEYHRTTRVYAALTLIVPAFGVGLLAQYDTMPGTWWLLSVVLLMATQLGLLYAVIIPAQERAINAPGTEDLGVLRASAGIYNLAWFATLIVMVVKPWF